MNLEVQAKVKPVSGCLRYPDGKQKDEKRRLLWGEVAKKQMADPALFISLAIKRRSAPPTEIVKKGQENHRFSFGFPVVVKPFDGREVILAESQAEVMQVTRDLKATGYQIQKYLRGYTFLKVQVRQGFVEKGLSRHVHGAIRSMVKLFVTQGVCNFTLTVATNVVTTYIIGAQVDQTH